MSWGRGAILPQSSWFYSALWLEACSNSRHPESSRERPPRRYVYHYHTQTRMCPCW